MVDVPAVAAWRHIEARAGFEVLFSRRRGDGHLLEGHTVAVEDGVAWSVHYSLEVDVHWKARTAFVACTSADGVRDVRIVGDGAGRWTVDGVAAAAVDGCLDVDLEASACTNMLPVRRLALSVGERAHAPPVYGRAPSLVVERLPQPSSLAGDPGGRQPYEAASPRGYVPAPHPSA